MSHSPRVYILLLNYRGTDDTLACLDSLKLLDYPNYRIIVIDNDSPDNSVDRLRTRLESQLGSFKLIESDANLGYSGGNNLGIRAALEEMESETGKKENDAYIWLLNNDTTVEPDTLSALVAEAQGTGGLVGSLLLYPDGSYQQVGTRIKWWTGSTKGYPEEEVQNGMPVETLTGASMLIPFKAIRQAGLLDESYFLYFEDGEASLRYAQCGYSLTIATGSKVFHKEGATTGKKSLMTQYYYHRNRMRMLMRFANPLQKITIGIYAAFRLLRSVVKSRLSRDPERKTAVYVQALALLDFWQGISGKCPHNLEILK